MKSRKNVFAQCTCANADAYPILPSEEENVSENCVRSFSKVPIDVLKTDAILFANFIACREANEARRRNYSSERRRR